VKIFAGYSSDSGLMSRIYKEHTNGTPKEQIIPCKNGKMN
jgi:hypothetical protein